MLRRKIVIASAAALFGSVANAQFGGLPGLGGGSKSSGGGDIGAQVDDFIKRSATLADVVGRALAAINGAFESETELANKRAELKAIDETTDPKEKQARMAKFYESERAKAASLAKSSDLKDKVKGLDAQKQKLIGQALFNFAIGLLQASPLVKSGQDMLKGASGNPMNITKLLPVKDAVPFLQKVVEDGSGTVTTFIKVAQGANISVPQASSESKPVDLVI